MTSATTPVPARREPELAGQTVVVIGGSAGIGLETARRARAEGADVVLTGRDPDRLRQAAAEVGARSTAAFDATDAASVAKFFQDLPGADRPRDGHGRRPALRAAAGDGRAQVRRAARRATSCWPSRSRATPLGQDAAGRHAAVHGRHRRPARRPRHSGSSPPPPPRCPPFTADLALELAPVRVNLIAAGFVDTPLSASLLGDQLEARRGELRATLPIGRVVGPADVAALAVHIMINTALTGATYDIDGGQQFVW